jgi:hypothetical protein
MKRFLLVVAVATLVSSCTDNVRARQFGGEETVQLEKDEMFINATWKENNLWLITKDSSGTYYVREKSSFGLMEGRVIIKPYREDLPMVWEEVKK